MLYPHARDAGSRFGLPHGNVLVGKRGKLIVGVGVLALAVGIVTGRLVGSKDEVLPPVDTGSPHPWMAAQTRMDSQAPMEAQPPLDTPLPTGVPAVTETRTPIDAQVPISPPAPPGAPARIDELLRAAHTALTGYRLTTPDTDSAYYYYQQVLAVDPHNRQATAGFSRIADRYLALASKAFEKGQETKARQYVTLGLRIKDDHPELLAWHHRLTSQETDSGGHDEPDTMVNSSIGDESPEPKNNGTSVGKFFRNVARIFTDRASQAPGDTADSQFPGRDGN
jgi:hypothetical protein